MSSLVQTPDIAEPGEGQLDSNIGMTPDQDPRPLSGASITDFSHDFADSDLISPILDCQFDLNLDWLFSNSFDEVFPSVQFSSGNDR